MIHKSALVRFITQARVHAAIQPDDNDLGNAILYRMCREHFKHTDAPTILAKTKIIGKTYSVALDRVKEKRAIADDFYRKRVVPAFLRSALDERIGALKRLRKPTENDIRAILQLHHYLVGMISRITALDKRSFSSKYLHFHLPNLFYLYDSRAVSALRKFGLRLPRKHAWRNLNHVDQDYMSFYWKCLAVRQHVVDKFGIVLTPRQLDRLLLQIANNALQRKHRNKN
jgi:hypothetical protein